MTVWTYSGDPSSSPKDAVRFLLGDTDPTFVLTISDPEINFLVSEWDGNTYFAAAAGAEQMAAQFARQVSYSSDDVQFGGDDLQQKYITLAQELRELYARKGRVAAPFDGSNNCNDWRERVDPITVGMTDNRRDGANAPLYDQYGNPFYLNPLADEVDSGYASDG